MNNGTLAGATWALGTGSSFSKVMNFNTSGVRVAVSSSNINLKDNFTVAAWVYASPGRSDYRIILSKGGSVGPGYFDFKLNPTTGNLNFWSPDLTGDMDSGFQLDDNVWHHVMVTYRNGQMKFYKDRRLMKTSVVTGTIAFTTDSLAIGALPSGAYSFGGKLAQVKVYNTTKAIDEVTSVVQPAGPTLNLKRGIVFDRIQKEGFPVKSDWQINANDIQVAQNMGFDHIKVLFTADQYISGSGLNTANMWYVDQVVNTALQSGLPVMVCLHPEPAFKSTYLGSQSGFTQMLSFYSAFAQYLAERWTPNQIAFQLMTEPFSNFEDWNIMYPQMVTAVRNYMPNHTLVISGDQVGSMDAMTTMIPIHDDNVYYSFTTYEPYQFGFNAWLGLFGRGADYWKDISYVPWPASPQIVADRMTDMLSTVKAADRTGAQNDLTAYGNGYYNRAWLNIRAMRVRDWNDSYGGNLHTMVVEFGAVDNVTAAKIFENLGQPLGATYGVYPQERVQFIRDLRESFESMGMGWDYWSFNENFTVLDPVARTPYGTTSNSQNDNALLSALGLQ